MSRSIRRHHTHRVKRNRRNYWTRENNLTAKQLGIVAKTPKPCGCWMCSNQRKLYGMKIQELRQIDEDPGHE